MGIQYARKVVVSQDGNTLGYYMSISDAARAYKTFTSTITNRISKGLDVDGIIFRYYTDEDEALPNLSPPQKQREVKYDKRLNTNREFKSDDVELDASKYNVITYEVKNQRVCITPCPFKESPKPFIGSGSCLRCNFNKGRNRKTHQVGCSYSNVKKK